MGLLWQLIVGGVIGWLAGNIMKRDIPGGVIGNIIAGLLGSTIGGYLFKDFGPIIGGMAVVPSLLGAIILIFVVSFLLKRKG
ncbi:GlsB/YeaQ/YmgE family stress response membrane protein [Aerococcaceae bacterium NML191292]|nr:GlsB/YeaQ/YmgE family stress response membrane protein [Aerococcaceae bacterium NML210727]MCW6654574.1 GlsB/YeaQ/YmgE family stress response membrane protein [Aerococcaceae bacterium NML201296]MCW6659195.1 GlsB/YeaQ/YmgE family stress response membrane protein [Aerococcaceae bacterium NML191292]MCW6661247.1 GlsB/YeaQ/YmgE family stress response membrane protein [Aerococcaceae bacterium NML201209]MCW6662526.1 GlsB/YeaQ/YmgE family stress response membrane protein [Aerococcaceae bacterium NML1